MKNEYITKTLKVMDSRERREERETKFLIKLDTVQNTLRSRLLVTELRLLNGKICMTLDIAKGRRRTPELLYFILHKITFYKMKYNLGKVYPGLPTLMVRTTGNHSII